MGRHAVVQVFELLLERRLVGADHEPPTAAQTEPNKQDEQVTRLSIECVARHHAGLSIRISLCTVNSLGYELSETLAPDTFIKYRMFHLRLRGHSSTNKERAETDRSRIQPSKRGTQQHHVGSEASRP